MENAIDLYEYNSLAVVDDPQERSDVGWLNAVCKDLEAAPKLMEAIKMVVADNPGRISRGSLKRKYYAWKKDGLAGLVDRRKLRKLGKANTWGELYMKWCENHNRSNKGAWRAMMAAFWAGEIMEFGVGTWRDQWRAQHPNRPVPESCPAGWVPKQARYENLQRDAKKNADYMFQIVASRRGSRAAHEFLLPVLRTRVGLKPGQVMEFDDVHVDVEINMHGIGKVARPQMFVGYDIASGHKVIDVARPQYPDEATGKRNSLKEREFRFMMAALLTQYGFHRDGVRLVIEHGTTAIRETLEEQIKRLPVFGDLITFERSGILAEAVHAGLFKGDGGGNFKLKAYCEKMHSVEHSRRAMLPGQVGMDAEHRPEGHAGLVRYEQQMMRAVETLPASQRDMIRFNLLDWSTYCQAAAILSDAIADDPDHRLEGWDGREVLKWRLSETDAWHDLAELKCMTEVQRDAILAFLQANPNCKRVRRMTRREVWTTGLSELIRIPMFELPQLLDNRLIKDGGDVREVKIKKDGTFQFQDSFYYGDDAQVFHASCKTRAGFLQSLIPGRRYPIYTTPYHTDFCAVMDPDSGALLGLAPHYKRAPHYDRQAIIEAAGAQNHDLAVKMMPVRGRHQREAEARLELIGHNADVYAGRKIAPLPEVTTDATLNDLYANPVEEEW